MWKRLLLNTAAVASLATAALLPASGSAWAWGHTGHVEISRLAASLLPSDLPAFLRTPDAVEAIA